MPLERLLVLAAGSLLGFLAGWLFDLPIKKLKLTMSTLPQAVVGALLMVILGTVCLFPLRLLADYTATDPDRLLLAYICGFSGWAILGQFQTINRRRR